MWTSPLPCVPVFPQTCETLSHQELLFVCRQRYHCYILYCPHSTSKNKTKATREKATKNCYLGKEGLKSCKQKKQQQQQLSLSCATIHLHHDQRLQYCLSNLRHRLKFFHSFLLIQPLTVWSLSCRLSPLPGSHVEHIQGLRADGREQMKSLISPLCVFIADRGYYRR